ncbi:hypothetical protein GCM10009548_08620 [Streptomyces malaysiensis subsp. malaysiensis]
MAAGYWAAEWLCTDIEVRAPVRWTAVDARAHGGVGASRTGPHTNGCVCDRSASRRHGRGERTARGGSLRRELYGYVSAGHTVPAGPVGRVGLVARAGPRGAGWSGGADWSGGAGVHDGPAV